VSDILPETAPLVDGLLRPHAGKPSVPGFETAFTRSDGQTLWLGVSGASIKNAENREIGCILVIQDLTAFRNMQEHLKRIDRLAAVGRLAAGLAHEVRNPLASISGSIQVLKKSLQPKDADSHLMDIIVQESNNLSMLISDFTQYARAEAPGKEKLELKTVADEVLELFKNSAECRHVATLDQLIPEALLVTANRQQMKQVLWNLLLNSAQAMIGREGAIRVKAAAVAPGSEPSGIAVPVEGLVEISIADEGCGIKPSDLGSIFDPFFTTKDNGIGLGLAIVHKIIQEHGGLITVASGADEGTEFKLYLPAAPAEGT
jgi:two-component system sensor histidine kinase PilS (NtrC family)